MLKTKHYTTPLILPEERPPLEELPVKKHSVFRVFWIAWKLLSLIVGSLNSKFSRHSTARERAIKCRYFLERLGGMWIKVGQVLGMRSDLFSMEFCQELSKLQDRAFAFSAERSVAIIEENLGRRIDEVFDHFEVKPFAAASLSQVHKARLRKKKDWVAVKVQRPFATEYFRYDFKWLTRIFGVLEFFDILEHYHWGEMLAEIKQMVEEELDYRHEAANMRKLRKSLKDHKIYVPKVYLKYNTKVLLVMEFLHGVFMSDYINVLRVNPQKVADWNVENDIDPERVASRLLCSVLRQLYEDLIFHADLHPGNIVLLRKNRLAFIDFGIIGTFDSEFAVQYDQYSRALSKGQLAKAADLFLITLGKLPVLDVFQVRKEIINILDKQIARSRIKNLPYSEKSLAGNSGEMNRLLGKYKFSMNWNLLKMGRTFGAIDQNVGLLNSKFNYQKETKKYHLQSAKRKRSAMISHVPNLFEKIADLTNIIVPTILKRTLQFGGVIRNGTHVVAFIFRVLSRSFAIILLVLAWIYLYQHHTSVVDGYHESRNWFTAWVESIPALGKAGWYLLLALLLLTHRRFKKFTKNLLTPPNRLPGDTR